MKRLFLGFATTALLLTSCKSTKYAELGDGIFADIQTTKGDIIVKLYHEATPVTVANFVSLAEGDNPYVTDSLKGRNYYDGIIFHRIIKDFMIQGGDPLGKGIGGPGYKFKDEFVDSLRHTGKGILSMANSGPTTNGSQFFITHKATPWLDGKHTIFGEVVTGIGVVDSIAGVKVDASNKPEVEVAMKHVEIVRNGKVAKKFDAVTIMGNYFEEAERLAAEFKAMKEGMVTEFNTQMENAEETNSGLKILRLTNGDGQQPQTGQKVLVNYAGWLLQDGELFDSNIQEVAKKFQKIDLQRRDRGLYRPMPMDYSPDSRLVPGFREGLLSMKVGDKVRLFIPPYLGYGDRDNGPIPGGSTLVFDVEITGIAQ